MTTPRLVGGPTKRIRRRVQPTNGGQPAFIFPDRFTTAASATSMLTLPTVRKISGTIYTATSSASGAMGTPSASAIGAIELM